MTAPYSTRPRPTAEHVRNVLDYDPGAGVLTWKYRTDIKAGRGRSTFNSRFAGKAAGCRFKKRGGRSYYIAIGLDYVTYPAHCLAYLWMIGEWSDSELDHRNGDGTDNRWENIRPATPSQNLANRGANKNNKLGLKGVSLFKRTGRYQAQIFRDGVPYWLGYHDTPEEAHAAYCTAATKLYGEFARFK